MRTELLQAFTFSSLCFISASPAFAQLIYSNDFEHYPADQKYRAQQLNADWNFPEWENGVSEGRVRIENGPQAYGGSGSCLMIKSPKGKYGSSNSGASWKLHFDASYNEVYASYHIKFKKYFDFVKGGKIPGLAGGTAPTGQTSANGYNGWTARMMWRTDHIGSPGKPKQKTSFGQNYAKFVGSGYAGNGKNEDDTPWSWGNGSSVTLKSNRWYRLTQRIKMNTPGIDNGILQIWLDGSLVFDRRNVEFRKTVSLGIDQFYFSHFFGGGSSWKTSKWETVYFDNFEITAVQ